MPFEPIIIFTEHSDFGACDLFHAMSSGLRFAPDEPRTDFNSLIAQAILWVGFEVLASCYACDLISHMAVVVFYTVY